MHIVTYCTPSTTDSLDVISSDLIWLHPFIHLHDSPYSVLWETHLHGHAMTGATTTMVPVHRHLCTSSCHPNATGRLLMRLRAASDTPHFPPLCPPPHPLHNLPYPFPNPSFTPPDAFLPDGFSGGGPLLKGASLGLTHYAGS